jgi:putative ABC transport system permease protein
MLTGVAIRKIWRDLWRNKGRTSLVVLSIAVGVMAVGMILASNRLISRQLGLALQHDQLAHGILFLNGAVDEDTFAALARVPGVARVDGWAEATVRWRPSPKSEWKDATLTTIADYSHQVMNVLQLRSGAWPGADTIVVEASHVAPYGIPPIGGTLYLEINNRERPFRIGGTLRDPFQAPPPFAQNAALYVSRAAMERLAGVSNFNRIRFTVKGTALADVDAVAALLQKKIEKTGVTVAARQTYRPGEHPFQKTLDGFGLVLVVMAVASLFLSVFLVVNTINAVVAQQVPQIGMMKTVGAVSSEVAGLYLAGIVIYGGLSLILAVPLGAIGGDLLARGLLVALNIPPAPFELLTSAFLVQIGAGLLTPVLAALWPILEGTRITVREAIAAYGLGRGRYGAGWVDRVLGRVRGLPSTLTLSLRNTFRRMGRVALTELTLIAAGAIFMMIVAAGSSFDGTLDEFWKGFGFDVLFGFTQPQLISRVAPMIAAQPEVDRVEMWLWESGKIHKAGDNDPTKEKKIDLRAVPVGTQLYRPQLVAGRNLLAGDGHAIILDQKLAKTLAVGLGDQVVIEIIGSGKSSWSVVGLALDVIGGTGYVHFDALATELGQVGRASVVEIKTRIHTLAAQQGLERILRDNFKKQGIGVSFTLVEKDFRQQQSAAFSIITNVLQVMTVLMALVGSLGLSGTLSINVFERRREIGVMRAVGASSVDVALVFMTEGLILGLASWLQALPISYIGGQFFVGALGSIFDFPFVYRFPPEGALTWLGIIILLSVLASWLPARRATQISVRESLAYE